MPKIETSCSIKFTFKLTLGFFLIELKISLRKSADICTGKTPIFKQLFLKISAKKLEITQRNP